MHRWCWEGRRSIIFPSAVTMAGWKIELSDDLTQTVPAYRWSQISTVSGHCLHFRSICSSKNCFAYQSSLVKSGKPPFNSCLCPKQGKNMVHSGRMHQRKQQIKPRQNRIYKRFIVAFLVVGVARLELAASCSQICPKSDWMVANRLILCWITVIFIQSDSLWFCFILDE